MLQQLAEYFQGFSWSKLFLSILLIAIAVAGLSLYEAHTQSIGLQRAKAALEVANSAEGFRKQADGKLSPAQQSIYDGALRLADSATNETPETIKLQHSTMKFLAGLLPWLLMAFVYIGEKSKDSFIGMFGAVIIGVGAAGLLALVPDIAWPWLNLAVFPVVPFFFILGCFAYASRHTKHPM
ncbi:MAG: hypothetical protein ACYCZA_10050 [Thiobacillus sp.]